MTDNEDIRGDRGGDTGNTKQVGKGAGAEKGDSRRQEHDVHQPEGQTRNSPGARRTEHDEQPGSSGSTIIF